MISALIGAGAALGSAIYGGIKSAQAAKKQENNIKEQAARDAAWYERNYYQNYLDNSESKAAIKRVEDTMRRRNQEAQATAAVTGATPEQQVAQQSANNNVLSDTVDNLASRSDAQKNRADMINMNNQHNTTSQLNERQAQKEQGAAQFSANAGNIIGGALQANSAEPTAKTNVSAYSATNSAQGTKILPDQINEIKKRNSLLDEANQYYA